MPDFKAILFDLDGTLLDTTPLIMESFDHTCRTHLGRTVPMEEVLPFFGQPLIDACRHLAQLGDLDASGPEALLQTYRRHNLAHHDHLVTVFPGVPEVIRTLYHRGLKLAVVTSKVKETSLRGLRLFGLEDYFQEVVALEDVERYKPDPEPVRVALNLLEAEPEAALMVGDSPHDLMAGQGAGTKTAAVGWSRIPRDRLLESRPDFFLETPADLLSLALGPDN